MQGEGVYVVMVSVMSNPDYSFICQLHQEDFYFIDEHVNDRNMWLSPLKKLLKEGRYFIFRKLDGTLLGEKLREKHIVEHKKEEERESHREYYANIGLMSSISEQNREYEKGNFEFD